MTVTIIICTRNRAAYLERTLRAAVRQRWSGGSPCEVLVIDNGSTDDTAAVVSRVSSEKGGLTVRYVEEPELGLSHARNRALREARGSYLCFLDDDAVPEPEWLEWLMRGFQTGGADVWCVGGRIQPVYERDLPCWISGRHEEIYMPTMQERTLYPTTFPHYPYGANFAIRATCAKTVGLFNPNLGYRGRQLIPGEETEYLLRIEKAGFRIVMEPRACVRHVIPVERFAHAYYWRRMYAGGTSAALLEAAHFTSAERRVNAGRACFRLLVQGAVVCALAAVRGCLLVFFPRTKNRRIFDVLTRLSERLGYTRAAWLIVFRNPRKRIGFLWPVFYANPAAWKTVR